MFISQYFNYYLCCINMNSLHLYCMNIKSASCSLFIVYHLVLTRVSLECQPCPSRGLEHGWSATERLHNSGTGPQDWQACCVCTWHSPCTEGSAVQRKESLKDNSRKAEADPDSGDPGDVMVQTITGRNCRASGPSSASGKEANSLLPSGGTLILSTRKC